MPVPFITIVSGLPRSGTSMMMQMLAAGGLPAMADHLRAADEDNQRGYFEFEPVKRTKHDASWLRDAPAKVVKMVYMLLYDLPPEYQYRVVFMERKLTEVLASQQAMLARRGEPGANLSPEQMGRVFQQQLQKVCEWLSRQPNFRVLRLDYQQVLDDPTFTAERLNDFLGGQLDTAAITAAVDPALHRQRR